MMLRSAPPPGVSCLSWLCPGIVQSFTVLAGLAVIAASVVLFVSEFWSPTRSAVSPENGPLAIRLASLAGLGWLLVGLGIGSKVATGDRSRKITVMVVTGSVLSGLMGLLAWGVISFMFSS